MKSSAQHIGNRQFSDTDRLFFDANIWLYIFSPKGIGGKLERVYSSAFNSTIKAKSQLFTDVLVMSEYVNTYARIKWQNSSAAKDKFKKFRISEEFKPIAEEIASAARRITSCCTPLDSGFPYLQIEDVLTDYAKGEFDFNDQIIAELCRKKKLTLVTHDGDFKNHRAPLLTANRKLLQ